MKNKHKITPIQIESETDTQTYKLKSRRKTTIIKDRHEQIDKNTYIIIRNHNSCAHINILGSLLNID